MEAGASSYLERVQKVAQLESQLKMQRLERDMPKFLRAQRSYVDTFAAAARKIDE